MRRSHDSVRQASKTQARIASNQHRNQRLRDRVIQSYRRGDGNPSGACRPVPPDIP